VLQNLLCIWHRPSCIFSRPRRRF